MQGYADYFLKIKPFIKMDKFTINFSANQKLPNGYSVEFWESDEHYHFTTPDENFESEIYCTRFMARKACLKYIASLISA